MPLPGLHNLENAAAAALVALDLGVPAPAIERALPRFPGLARRFEVVGVTAAGIRVVDDYAHNAEKLRAALATAQAGCDRLVAVFQPHGFGPARFMGWFDWLFGPPTEAKFAAIFMSGVYPTRVHEKVAPWTPLRSTGFLRCLENLEVLHPHEWEAAIPWWYGCRVGFHHQRQQLR